MTRHTKLPPGLAGTTGTAMRAAGAHGNESAQAVPVTLGWDLADGLLTVTATTPKRGASCRDSWSVSPSLAIAPVSVGDAFGACLSSHVSRAAVDASLLTPETTYTFTYGIVMRTAASAWFGSRSIAVTVGEGGSVTHIPVGDGPARP